MCTDINTVIEWHYFGQLLMEAEKLYLRLQILRNSITLNACDNRVSWDKTCQVFFFRYLNAR